MRSLLAAAAVVAALALVPLTSAGFTDAATLRSGTLAAGRLAEPGPLACTQPNPLLRAYVDLSWPAVAGARYRLSLQSGTTVMPLVELPTGTTTYRLQASTATSLLAVGEVITVRLRTSAGSRWVSTTETTRSLRRTAVLGVPVDITCA